MLLRGLSVNSSMRQAPGLSGYRQRRKPVKARRHAAPCATISFICRARMERCAAGGIIRELNFAERANDIASATLLSA
jgi:hypothetical protein